MELIDIPRYAVSGNNTVSQLKEAIKQKLSEFCLEYLKSLKYVSQGFSGGMYLRDYSNDRSKSLGRLAKILYRNCVKVLPSLSYAISPGQKGVLIHSVDGLRMDFFMYGTTVDRSIARYCKYINYLCRKHGLPLNLSTEALEGTSSSIEGTVQVTIKANLVVNYPNVNRSASQEAVESLLRGQREELLAQGRNPDAVFSNSEEFPWGVARVDQIDSLSTLALGPESSCMYKLMCPERVVMYSPQIVRAVTNLSRKFAYATDAFSISPAVNSGD